MESREVIGRTIAETGLGSCIRNCAQRASFRLFFHLSNESQGLPGLLYISRSISSCLDFCPFWQSAHVCWANLWRDSVLDIVVVLHMKVCECGDNDRKLKAVSKIHQSDSRKAKIDGANISITCTPPTTGGYFTDLLAIHSRLLHIWLSHLILYFVNGLQSFAAGFGFIHTLGAPANIITPPTIPSFIRSWIPQCFGWVFQILGTLQSASILSISLIFWIGFGECQDLSSICPIYCYSTICYRFNHHYFLCSQSSIARSVWLAAALCQGIYTSWATEDLTEEAWIATKCCAVHLVTCWSFLASSHCLGFKI